MLKGLRNKYSTTFPKNTVIIQNESEVFNNIALQNEIEIFGNMQEITIELHVKGKNEEAKQ